jgi:hypothetical protein
VIVGPTPKKIMISLSALSVAFISVKTLEGAVLGAFFTLFTLIVN